MSPRNVASFVILFVIAFTGILVPCVVQAKSPPRIEISPKIIRQGDAFAVQVTGIKSSLVPTANVGKNTIRFSGCGKGCFIGIGAVSLQSKTGTYPVKVRIGKKRKNLSLTVMKGAFQKITITLPDEKVILSPADLEVVKEENRELKTLFLATSERLWDGAFILPVDNEISTSFGTKRIMNNTWTSIHRGIDIKGAEGEEVRASNNGRVVLSRELFFGGNTVILDHGQGIHTVYMHLSQMKVACGDSVSKGDVIGLVGSSGRSTGPHLHFGVKVSNISVNPLSVVNLAL